MMSTRPGSFPKRFLRGFTLIELLVVIVIVGLLAGMLLPVLGKSKAKARDTYCLNSLRQLGIAVVSYAQDYGSRLPMAEGMPTMPADPAHPLPRICDLLRPYVGDGTNVFRCPNDRAAWFSKEGSSYEWNYALGGTIIDKPGFWLLNLPPEKAPLMYDYDNVHIGADGSGTKNTLYADGHVAPL
jgi:prepilin-type N-terminal cleavage/methylation domain-containing protein/prepilin-type processing-associated H-X9-DG protein